VRTDGREGAESRLWQFCGSAYKRILDSGPGKVSVRGPHKVNWRAVCLTPLLPIHVPRASFGRWAAFPRCAVPRLQQHSSVSQRIPVYELCERKCRLNSDLNGYINL
jgi:hypothetical protein